MALNLPPGWDVGRLREFLKTFEELCITTVSASRTWELARAFHDFRVWAVVKAVEDFNPGEDHISKVESDYAKLEFQLIVAGGGDAGTVRRHEFKEHHHEDANFHGLALKLIRNFWTEFLWMLDIQNGEEADVGLSGYSLAEGLSDYHDISESISSLDIHLKREKAFLLDKISHDLGGVLVSEDGPSMPGEFIWNGTTLRGLEPTPWRLLNFLWKQPGRLGRYSQELAQFVWMDRNYDYEEFPIKEAARDIRNFFRAHEITLTCTNSTSSRYVAIKSSVSTEDT